MNVKKLVAYPEIEEQTFLLFKDLITTDKHTGDDIWNILDDVNEIRRKIATDKNISNSHMLVSWGYWFFIDFFQHFKNFFERFD